MFVILCALKGVIRALSPLLIAIIAVSGTVALGVDSETYTVNNKVNQFEEKMVRIDLDIYIVDIPEANTYKLTKTIGQFFTINSASAHRSGCHRWHSCPSDSGSYTCGDLGYPCRYPTYPSSGGVVYPPSGYYKDCDDCPIKKVPANSHTLGISWSCDSGYKKVGTGCQEIVTRGYNEAPLPTGDSPKSGNTASISSASESDDISGDWITIMLFMFGFTVYMILCWVLTKNK